MPNKPTILAIGTFDGVHLGHRRILETLLKMARQRDLVAKVAVFPYSPRAYFAAGQAESRKTIPSNSPSTTETVRLLTSVEERLEIFREEFGITDVEVLPLSRRFFNLSAGAFLSRYVCRLWNAKNLVVGETFSIGRGRQCNESNFRDFFEPLGLGCHKVPLKKSSGIALSSTRIRGLLAEGDLAGVNRFLGRPYSISGRVVRGDGIGGKVLGFPTANLAVDSRKLLPRGVFQAYIEELNRSAVVNIGCRPTIKSAQVRKCASAQVENENIPFLTCAPVHLCTDAQVVEAHILDFKEDLYGRTLTLKLLKKIRQEKHFPSLADLRSQIGKDVRAASGEICQKGSAIIFR